MPLVDLVLLLVLFFALAQGVGRARLEPVELPDSAFGEASDSASEPPVVTVREDGRLLFRGRSLGASALATLLAEEESPRVRLRADRRVAFGAVRGALAALEEAGVRTTLLGVKEAPRAGRPARP